MLYFEPIDTKLRVPMLGKTRRPKAMASVKWIRSLVSNLISKCPEVSSFHATLEYGGTFRGSLTKTVAQNLSMPLCQLKLETEDRLLVLRCLPKIREVVRLSGGSIRVDTSYDRLNSCPRHIFALVVTSGPLVGSDKVICEAKDVRADIHPIVWLERHGVFFDWVEMCWVKHGFELSCRGAERLEERVRTVYFDCSVEVLRTPRWNKLNSEEFDFTFYVTFPPDDVPSGA